MPVFFPPSPMLLYGGPFKCIFSSVTDASLWRPLQKACIFNSGNFKKSLSCVNNSQACSIAKAAR